LLNCALCQRQLWVCGRCDHGQRYCAEPCAAEARRQSVRAAGQRYQKTFGGRLQHARRQSRWRERQRQKVTHQGFPLPESSVNVADQKEGDDDEGAIEDGDGVAAVPRAGQRTACRRSSGEKPRCAWCGAVVGRLAQLRRWRP
jgi:hypothetical protein